MRRGSAGGESGGDASSVARGRPIVRAVGSMATGTSAITKGCLWSCFAVVYSPAATGGWSQFGVLQQSGWWTDVRCAERCGGQHGIARQNPTPANAIGIATIARSTAKTKPFRITDLNLRFIGPIPWQLRARSKPVDVGSNERSGSRASNAAADDEGVDETSLPRDLPPIIEARHSSILLRRADALYTTWITIISPPPPFVSTLLFVV